MLHFWHIALHCYTVITGTVIYIIKAVMSVCLFVCSVWPAKRLGRSRPNLTHALMSTPGVFLARSMSRSLMYACGSNRSTKHPQSDTWRMAHYGAHSTSGRRRRRHLANDYETPSNYSSSNEAGAELRPEDGNLQLVYIYFIHLVCMTWVIATWLRVPQSVREFHVAGEWSSC